VGEKMTEETVRPSKAVLTSGPGAIIDLKGGKSALVMSPDYWHRYEVIHEKRLAEELGVDHFRSPSCGSVLTEDGRQSAGIRIRHFPRNWYCPKCRKVQANETCRYCSTPDNPVATVPTRLVAACEGGHIEDFPWRWWVGCHNRDHILELHPYKGESDLIVICPECAKEKPTKDNPTPGRRTLKGALGAIPLDCHGRRPWIGDDIAIETCHRKLHGLMRSGSNVYFPLSRSSILIPKFSYRIYQKVISQKHLEFVKQSYDICDGDENDPTFMKQLESIIDRYYRKVYIDGENAEYTEDDFKNAFLLFCRPRIGLGIKEEEWHAFSDPEPAPRKGDEVEFDAQRLNISGRPFLRQFFDKIVLVKRLSEVRAQYGFTRINPVEEAMLFSETELIKPAKAHLREIDDAHWTEILDEMTNGNGDRRGYKGLVRVDASGAVLPRDHRNWLPGVKNKGEGVFFVFNKERLSRWEEDPIWADLCKDMLENGAETLVPIEDFDMGPRGILIHSFSHMLIKQLSQECGYSMASLKERMYVSKEKNMYGALIYTSAADSQGSLGGLIDQASDLDTLEEHIRAVIESARTCSQDPLCGMQVPKRTRKPWGAACHSCLHLPETSCEALMNKFLDRNTITGDGVLKKGYFS
jgi:hypothetical protein